MELIDDLVQINSLDKKDYQHVVVAISNNCGELEWGMLVKDISRKVDGDAIKALIRFINFLSDNVSELIGYNSHIKEINEFLTKLLNDEPKALLGWERVKGSLEDLDAFFLHKKEESIKNKFSRVTSFKIVTDVRPIFSMDKKSISKITYPSILKIETCDDKEFVCEFYEDTLDKLIEELQVAKDKLKLIRANYAK
ncbi:MAG: hypothetical protein HFP77_06530 [Methylococcales symbiont of Iophon sp. n. MRB-2018]|nr:MAG: hypothetical protein HFP77_06530 [Methylococcales symbiont of Iophon sp. n. MRB-2018]KAF3979661.1 MAG: hypothetical protein HFP76_05900 [Methylococcales symbiont of Iophon sp. n. MRB-2018]